MTRDRGAGLVRSDATRIPLADASVDLIITSPPYFALRSYQDDGEHYGGQIGSEPTPADFLRALWAVTDECWRVLKSTGSFFCNLGDKYGGSGGHNNAGVGGTGRGPSHYNQTTDVRPKSLMGLPWRYALGLTCPDPYRTVYGDTGPQWIERRDLIWHKLNGLPESVTDRCRTSHEYWFHLTKEPHYFAAVDEVRETYSDRYTDRVSTYGSRDRPPPSHDYAPGDRKDSGNAAGILGMNQTGTLNPLGKLPGSVWSIPSEPLIVPEHLGVDHFAAFPTEWPRRLILGWSSSGICTACGEGRRPVVESERSPYGGQANKEYGAGNHGTGATTLRSTPETTITGYACACPDTSAPTRPAVVLDPFAGTGTVPMVARTLGRYGIGLDLSRDYLRLATWRIWHSGHGRKAEARTNRERQGALFGGDAA